MGHLTVFDSFTVLRFKTCVVDAVSMEKTDGSDTLELWLKQIHVYVYVCTL
ncbi:hypothetical protein WH47_03896 [Habropoda laboriosa]|uniref:Uncharacterized protein n=1 Tax=Habropoda laboriosa TaxID=597456 RepID=A0A0L7QX09_9HYME|nr:hypothetical protein WH47_03896 [Habropoda laboriosa]